MMNAYIAIASTNTTMTEPSLISIICSGVGLEALWMALMILFFVGIFLSFYRLSCHRHRAPSTVRENRLSEMPQRGMDIELADISRHSRHLFTIAEEEGGTELELVDRGKIGGENRELGATGNREMNGGHSKSEKEKLEELDQLERQY